MRLHFKLNTLAVTVVLATTCLATRGEELLPLSTEGKPAEGKPAEGKPTEGKPTDGKHVLPWEKTSITLGGCMAALNSSVGFGVNGAGVNINAQEVLGLDSTLVVFRAGALYRPGQSLRHQLDFTYAAYNRSSSGTLSQDITIDGTTYPLGARIKSHLDFAIIRGTYSYAILQDERMRIALGISVYAVPLNYGLSVQTTGGYSSVGGGDVTLPLPALALRSEFLLVPKLYLSASIDAMYLKVGDFQGSLMDVNFGIEYRIWKHFGLGLDYNPLAVHVEENGSSSSYPGADFTGSVDVRYNALMLYGKFSF